MPNVHELQSLVNYGNSPAIYLSYFPSTGVTEYCSSTSYIPQLSSSAWYVHFGDGEVYQHQSKWYSLDYVRAVRGGQSGSFDDSDEDGILDDGDNSGTLGDNPCTGGQTENCDDNCLNQYNPDQQDTDGDGVGDVCDNCPDHPNGPLLGTCTSGPKEWVSVKTCISHTECDPNGFCSMNQEDIYPPGGNGIGDACECESDFDCDGDVDAEDVTKFLEDFGRNQYNNPCPPCSGYITTTVPPTTTTSSVP